MGDSQASLAYCSIKLNVYDKVLAFVPSGTYETGSATEVLRLNQGDRVQVGHCSYANGIKGNDVTNSFSGVLVKAEN